ncbi:3849_t:CDS:1, partial [Racocetra fulgida]
KKSILGDKDECIITDNGKFGTCALEVESCFSSNSSEEDGIVKYNPKESPYIIGNYFTYNESACLFIYNNKKEEVKEKTVLKRLALYSWQVKYYLASL